MGTKVCEIRLMQYDDLDHVVEIESISFPTPWSRNAFASELFHNSRACYLVASVDGRVVGYVGTWLILDEAHVTNIAVHPDYRRQGIGEKLLRSMMALAGSRGAKRMTLEVRVSNKPAQRLYEKLGFVRIGLRRGYYHDNNEDAIIMWKEGLM
ncbi:MAG TPA: ribosomal protein S18-alanine N-acetyltransferase [Firmicutes bacterium]|nr:ribosomal protein S18-alanine N-acetyltransferase [Bacillota bacterium]